MRTRACIACTHSQQHTLTAHTHPLTNTHTATDTASHTHQNLLLARTASTAQTFMRYTVGVGSLSVGMWRPTTCRVCVSQCVVDGSVQTQRACTAFCKEEATTQPPLPLSTLPFSPHSFYLVLMEFVDPLCVSVRVWVGERGGRRERVCKQEKEMHN